MEQQVSRNQRGVLESRQKALTIAQACQTSGLSRSFIYKKFASGELPRLKAGKRVLILREDLEAYLLSIRECA
ncbi:helix-turn-helix domain-containing protein [Ahrensia kielensis]|uniref:helix-turn-helix domain-containing protein n=1 Tax=Ahrensia kielensis TaxID=76980 RepID=UPI0009FFCB9F